jgi:hypothetical protein
MLGQNNLLDNTFKKVELTLTLSFNMTVTIWHQGQMIEFWLNCHNFLFFVGTLKLLPTG